MVDCFQHKKTYLKAAFRGVSFEVDTADSEHGKRNAVHEFPFRDTPYCEDLGRKARRFSIEGYFVSDDHVDRKHRLAQAIEASGPGVLAHPYYGTVSVICDTCTFHDEKKLGRRTSFVADFIEAGSWLYPSIFGDNRGLLLGVIGTAIGAVVGAFDANYIATARSLSSSALGGVISDFGARLREGVEINGDVAQPSYVKALGAAERAQASPVLFALDGKNVSQAVYNYSQAVLDARKFLKGITEFVDYPTVPFQTPGNGIISQVERQSGEAFVRLVKSVTAIEAARATIDIDLKTRVDAEERLSTAVRMLDSGIELASQDFDDDSRSHLEAVKNEVTRDIYLQIGKLPVLITTDFRHRLPSLVVADRLWQNANRRDEVRDGNPVMHPLWEPNCIVAAQA